MSHPLQVSCFPRDISLFSRNYSSCLDVCTSKHQCCIRMVKPKFILLSFFLKIFPPPRKLFPGLTAPSLRTPVWFGLGGGVSVSRFSPPPWAAFSGGLLSSSSVLVLDLQFRGLWRGRRCVMRWQSAVGLSRGGVPCSPPTALGSDADLVQGVPGSARCHSPSLVASRSCFQTAPQPTSRPQGPGLPLHPEGS